MIGSPAVLGLPKMQLMARQLSKGKSARIEAPQRITNGAGGSSLKEV